MIVTIYQLLCIFIDYIVYIIYGILSQMRVCFILRSLISDDIATLESLGVSEAIIIMNSIMHVREN